MKKVMFFVLIAIILNATVLYAGVILDRFQDVTVSTAFKAVVAAIFFILGAFGLKKITRWRNVANEGVDVGAAIFKATRKNSPGGAMITGDEFEDILKKTGKFGAAVLASVGKTP